MKDEVSILFQFCLNKNNRNINLNQYLSISAVRLSRCEIPVALNKIPVTNFESKKTMLLLTRFNRVRLCATPKMAAHQAHPSLRFSRQEHWSGVPFPLPTHEKVKSLSRVQLLATPWIAAYQAPSSVGFSGQEYWSGLPLPSPKENHRHRQINVGLLYEKLQGNFQIANSYNWRTNAIYVILEI